MQRDAVPKGRIGNGKRPTAAGQKRNAMDGDTTVVNIYHDFERAEL